MPAAGERHYPSSKSLSEDSAVLASLRAKRVINTPMVSDQSVPLYFSHSSKFSTLDLFIYKLWWARLCRDRVLTQAHGTFSQMRNISVYLSYFC